MIYKNLITRFFVLLILMLLNTFTFSQSPSSVKRDYITNYMIWNNITIQGKIKKSRFLYQLDLEYRRQADPEHAVDPNTTIGTSNYNIVKNPYQMAIRPWLHYQPNTNIAFAVSPICWFGSWAVPVERITKFRPELRSSFQVTLSNSIGRLVLNNRYRYEMRFFGTSQIDDTSSLWGPKSSYNFPKSERQGRIRYMLRGTMPINSEKIVKGTYYVTANAEVLLKLGKNISNSNLVDQFRANIAMGWKFNDDIRVELGYLKMFAFRLNNQAKNNVDANNIIRVNLIFDNFSNLIGSDD